MNSKSKCLRQDNASGNPKSAECSSEHIHGQLWIDWNINWTGEERPVECRPHPQKNINQASIKLHGYMTIFILTNSSEFPVVTATLFCFWLCSIVVNKANITILFCLHANILQCYCVSALYILYYAVWVYSMFAYKASKTFGLRK